MYINDVITRVMITTLSSFNARRDADTCWIRSGDLMAVTPKKSIWPKTVIPAGGFPGNEQAAGQGESFTFGLSSKGDKVVLLDSGAQGGGRGGYARFRRYQRESYARTVDGGGEWWIAAVPTKGFSNTGGADAFWKGVLVINEGLQCMPMAVKRTTSISSNSMRAAATSTSVA